MSTVRSKRKPKGLTWLFCLPVVLVVSLAIAGNRGSALKSSEEYPRYFDRALERIQSTKTIADSQSQIDLMTISLRRMDRKNIDGQRVLQYADAVDRQLKAISVEPERWSQVLIAKVNSQNAFSDELINALASEQGPEQCNEVALAMLYAIPGKAEESQPDSIEASDYLEQSLKHFHALDPEARIRLLDAYVVLTVYKPRSEASSEFVNSLREARLTLATSLAKFPIDSQTHRLTETIDQLLVSPADRDLVIGSLEGEPIFFGSIARAAIMGEWSIAENYLGTVASDQETAPDWYRRNARVLGRLVTAIFLDRHERGAAIDSQWLEGLDLSLRLDGSIDEISRLVQSVVDLEVSGSSAVDIETARKRKILEVMDGNPASDSALMVRILRGSKDQLTRSDATTIAEALEVAELLNARILPLLVRQSFWELRTNPDKQPHVTCAAVRAWVDKAESTGSIRSVEASLEGYAGYAYFLSATAALEDENAEEAKRLLALSKQHEGPADSILFLEAKLTDLSPSDQSKP